MSGYTRHDCERSAFGIGALALAPISFGCAGLARDTREPRGVRIKAPRGLISRGVIKRTLDIVLALLALTIAGIPMLLIAAAIRLTSNGPALFSQERIGLNGRRFVMLKFRTMYHDAGQTTAGHHNAGARGSFLQATRDDPRVTRIGALLRHTSLDELPQLLNVLAGSMSLVGPRPHAPGTCAAGRPFEAVAEHYGARHCVKPGITGLAQIRGWRGETDTEEKFFGRLDSDLEYIATHSTARDVLILCRTVVWLLHMPNAY